MTLLIFLILISLLVFVHEGGHFLAAKLSGVDVEEFGFGIPPRVWGKKIGKTIYSINLLPIGGFVRLKGEEGELDEPGSFATKRKFSRFAIIFAGALGNLILAWFLFSLLFAIGYPKPGAGVEIKEVAQGSPAGEVGIKPSDIVVGFEEEKIQTTLQLQTLTKQNLDKEVTLTLKRGSPEGKEYQVRVYARPSPPQGQGAFGIVIGDLPQTIKAPLWKAPILGLSEVAVFTVRIYQALGSLFADLFRLVVPTDVVGVIGLAAVTGRVSEAGVKALLTFTALISVNLGVLNLLPFPALDGGRILFLGIEALRGRKVSPKTEALVHRIGFVVLIWLAIAISIRDLQRLF